MHLKKGRELLLEFIYIDVPSFAHFGFKPLICRVNILKLFVAGLDIGEVVNTVPRQGNSSARERDGMLAPLLSLGATAEPKTKRKWPAVPRATRTKRKIPAAGRSRYALPSRRIQHREGRIIRETKDRREQREANKCRKEERRIRRQCPAFDS